MTASTDVSLPAKGRGIIKIMFFLCDSLTGWRQPGPISSVTHGRLLPHTSTASSLRSPIHPIHRRLPSGPWSSSVPFLPPLPPLFIPRHYGYTYYPAQIIRMKAPLPASRGQSTCLALRAITSMLAEGLQGESYMVNLFWINIAGIWTVNQTLTKIVFFIYRKWVMNGCWNYCQARLGPIIHFDKF